MNTAVIALLLAALLAANLPFLVERILFVFPPKAESKALGWRLLELILLYFVVGGVAWLLQRKIGAVHPQNWEFYAITVSLFVVLSYPGFVYRYLWRR